VSLESRCWIIAEPGSGSRTITGIWCWRARLK